MKGAGVESVAKAIGVNESDIFSLLSMVRASLEQDRIKEIFLGMSEADRINTVQAYVSAEVKKFSEFCVSLLTNTEKKSAFDQYLLNKLEDLK